MNAIRKQRVLYCLQIGHCNCSAFFGSVLLSKFSFVIEKRERVKNSCNIRRQLCHIELLDLHLYCNSLII